MSLRTYRTFQALILGGLGIFLFSIVMDGRILYYINQRFVILVLLAALGLIFLAQYVLRERPALPGGMETHPPHGHEDEAESGSGWGWTLWLLALPLLIGILVPVRPLSAAALAIRGVSLTASLPPGGEETRALSIPSGQRTVLDWLRLVNKEPQSIEGQPADVTGFVYHDPRLAADQFLVSRFSIACCVADAAAFGMVVTWPEAAGLPDNQWVRVRGPVRLVELDGKKAPAIEGKTVELIPQPEQPYLFP